METLTFAGKEYVKAKSAARELGYTPDYIGQLCRAGKIDARLVGRSWYVDIEELADHKKLKYGKKNTKAIKGRSGSKAQSVPDNGHFGGGMNYHAHAKQPTAYEADQEALLPPIQKKEKSNQVHETPAHIDDEAYADQQIAGAAEADQTGGFEAEKSHKIDVIDATEEPEVPPAAESAVVESTKAPRHGAPSKDQSKYVDTVMPPKRASSSPDSRYVRRHQPAQKSATAYTKGSSGSSDTNLIPYVLIAAVAAAVILILVLGVQIEITSTTAQTSEQFGFSVQHFMDKIGL